MEGAGIFQKRKLQKITGMDKVQEKKEKMKYLILILMGVIIIQQIINPFEIEPREIFEVNTLGNSMEPLIHSGDKILIEDVKNKNELRVGDIVLYENYKGINILHEIEYIGEDEYGIYYVIKGVNNDCPDGVACWLEEGKGKSIAFKIRFKQILGVAI